MRILLVEDDLPLAKALQRSLQSEGFVVNHVNQGKLALNALSTPDQDMIILDLGLPDIDGLDVLKHLRNQKSSLPVIILTARDSIESKVKGLDYGADDYLVKPFEIQELMARLRVIERRLGTANSSLICVGQVKLDTFTHKVLVESDRNTINNEIEIHFSKKEFMVLKALMENAGRILSREQIESKLYHWGEEVLSNAVEVHIHKLRKSLPEKFIQNVRGVGYIINNAY
ncbi:response regulator transcription factor [Candidatus Colwellia aromaticivorans]|uniref:response regulator transcription factor n=1 Tax=Candidatus Colwellia aromaticivorans TaxID=2267621 RepID=UPI000DF35A5E|nr:response regulator transcription factor [Candidatus Colwellia aromaticivorans]